MINLEFFNFFFRYSVFGLGNSSYEEFCGFGHFMNKHLANIGAKSIYPIGEGDELGGQKESFDLWSAEVMKVRKISQL